MSRFIESIRLDEGKFGDINYHQARMDLALAEFYKGQPKINLEEFLSSCPMPSIGLHKVRLVYDREIQSIQINHYTPRTIKKIKLIQSDSITYNHKFEDRSELENLYSQRGKSDDIIIIKNNKITDSSFSNLAFKKGNQWFTPGTFLLNGTMRQQLIHQKVIIETEITKSDLSTFEKVKLINSMLLFNGPEIDVSQIVE